MKIIADKNIPLANEFFSVLGDVVLIPPREMSADNLHDADALVVRSVVPIDKSLLDNTKIKFVGSCTAGIDHLDTHYMDEEKIAWSGAPGCNANAVVEYVLSVLAVLNQEKGFEWWNKTIGIIGCGNVGSRLYKKLTALGVSCRCYDPLIDQNSLKGLTTLENVLASDVVCVHAPLTKTGKFPSYHLLGMAEIERLTANTVLISAGRGAVIDNRALVTFLQARADVIAVLDVWESEPLIPSDLLSLVRLATPHIAGHSYDGKVKGTEIIYQKLCRFLNKPVECNVTDFDKENVPVKLTLPKGNLYQKINHAMLSAHDVRQDDHLLRQSLADVGVGNQNDSENRTLVFDRLRKNYRKRREFSNFTVSINEAELDGKNNAALKNMLDVLGFKTEYVDV